MARLSHTKGTSRKTFGVLLSDTDGNYNNIVWQAVDSAAQKFDCNIIAFEGRDIDNPGIDYQHNVVYDLAAHANLDGYLLLSSQMSRFASVERFQDFCKPLLEKGVPVLSFGIPVENGINLNVDSLSGFRKLLDHLIVDHQYKNIAFVKGPDLNKEAMERLELFRSIMREHSLPIDERLIVSGDFTPPSGYRAYKQLDRLVLPIDCIVCTNDDMAMGAYQYVDEQIGSGQDVPTIHITGFDNTLLASLSKPGLTTVSQPFDLIMENAMEWMTHPETIPDKQENTYPSELQIRESCGCTSSDTSLFSKNLFLQATRNHRLHQTMQTFSLDDLFADLSGVLDDCSIQSCYVTKYPESFFYPETRLFPEESEFLYAWMNRRQRTMDQPILFPTADLVPDRLSETFDQRYSWLVKPLFFNQEQMGFMIFEPSGKDTRNFEAVRGQVSNTLKVTLLLQRQKDIENQLAHAVVDLQSFNKKLNVLSVKDELSGLYNRRGFFDKAEQCLRQTDQGETHYLLMYADIDGMKNINDLYGHAEGDIAIKATASILNRVFREKDIVARIGGDEFVVLASGICEEQFPNVASRIYSLLDDYNKNAGKPYRLEFSLGHVDCSLNNNLMLEALLKKADVMLYEQKRLRKQRQGK